MVAVFFLAAQNNSEKYHMKNTQKLRFEKKTSEARNKNTPQNISHCSQPHLFFALYNGVKPRCEAPGKRNDTTISKSLKPSLFVANVEDPRSELLSSNKRERRLGDALSRSQANQQTHWEKEKRGRTYSKVDLRSLSFNSNIKKIWRITNTISHQARFSSAKLSLSGTFKRKSLKWCRLAKLARLARCLSLSLLGSTFGRCVQFSPS